MFNLDDPKNQALIAMGLGLLGGAPRSNKNFGADLAHGGLLGLQAYAGAKQAQQREQEEAQQRQMRDMQMAEMQRAIQQRGQISDLARQSFAPPQALDPRQQEGGQQMVPGGGGMEAFARGMMQIDPVQGMQFMPKPRGPVALSKGSALVDPVTGQKIADNPEPQGPERGKMREVFKGGTLIQQEWDGKDWVTVGQGPRFKPDAPERPAAPQLYEGPNGPMWITPPSRGQGSVPVAGPDGKPLGPKAATKKLTEGEAKATLYTGMMQDAENAIAALNFDPSKLKNQTDIALARGDIAVLPKTLQNMVASKNAQQYAQGTFQWTEAMLRQLTGAAAPETEVWRQVKTYWPQPGDTPEVIKRKNQARAQVAAHVRIVAGEGANKADAAMQPNIEDLIKRYAR